VMGYLQVQYSQNQYWGHPLRRELQTKQSLAERDKEWSSSTLSDLAFSITTRLGFLQEIAHSVDQTLLTIDTEVRAEPDVDAYVAGGYAYSFDDVTAVRQVLVLITGFAAEAESLFENLVEFYRTFVKHYFDRSMTLSDAEAKVIGFTQNAKWRTDLNRVRNLTRHRFAPWLAFEDKGAAVQPRWEPILIHDWRTEKLSPHTSTSLAVCRDIKAAIAQAAIELRADLINQIRTAT
jgi:hypothetical protein